ncbi:MAG: STAS domain-containing protein [Kiloniellaceae bacterium]
MQISFKTIDGVVVLSVSGAADSHAAGQLNDTLVRCIADGTKKLIVDLSGVHIMTRAGLRGLIVAAKLMDTAQGQMRICGALRSVDAFLRSRGFTYLLTCDASLQTSLAELRGGDSPEADVPIIPILQAL